MELVSHPWQRAIDHGGIAGGFDDARLYDEATKFDQMACALAALGHRALRDCLQMLRNIAAPMDNYFVSILKAAPYLAVPEMLGEAFDTASGTYRYAELFTVAGIAFLVLALIITGAVRWLETRLSPSSAR